VEVDMFSAVVGLLLKLIVLWEVWIWNGHSSG